VRPLLRGVDLRRRRRLKQRMAPSVREWNCEFMNASTRPHSQPRIVTFLNPEQNSRRKAQMKSDSPALRVASTGRSDSALREELPQIFR
jgi:hypothetical protein